MTTPSPSKYSIDPQLYKPEPPVQPQQVKRLFFGRKRELRRGLDSLRAGMDLRGRQSRKADKRPWVIHGESRSGKSHLARRIFAGLPDNDTRLQFRINAGGRLEALAVLRDLFEEMRGRFLNRILDQRLTEDPVRSRDVQLAKQLVEKIALFDPATESATLTLEQEDRESGDAGVELGGTRLGKFIAKFQRERSEKRAVEVSLRPPTAVDLAEVCGIMAETLLRHKLVSHVLVLMDDVDLLEGYVSQQQNARRQRSLLADAIRVLHSAPGVDVVLTARSWYAHSQKELQTLVDLAVAKPMQPDEMVSIHDLRWETCSPRGDPAAFLTNEALRELANDVNGLPGVFLQHLQTAFYRFQDEDDAKPRGYDWLLDVFRQHLGLLRDRCSDGYTAIEKAVSSGKLTVDVTEHNPFFGTMLENEYAYQSYYSETAYFISGLVRKILGAAVGG
jgi:hypothetical protein